MNRSSTFRRQTQNCEDNTLTLWQHNLTKNHAPWNSQTLNKSGTAYIFDNQMRINSLSEMSLHFSNCQTKPWNTWSERLSEWVKSLARRALNTLLPHLSLAGNVPRHVWILYNWHIFESACAATGAMQFDNNRCICDHKRAKRWQSGSGFGALEQ